MLATCACIYQAMSKVRRFNGDSMMGREDCVDGRRLALRQQLRVPVVLRAETTAANRDSRAASA